MSWGNVCRGTGCWLLCSEAV